jgi:hypothetical protein
MPVARDTGGTRDRNHGLREQNILWPEANKDWPKASQERRAAKPTGLLVLFYSRTYGFRKFLNVHPLRIQSLLALCLN